MESNAPSGGDRKAGGKRRRRWMVILVSASGVLLVLLLAAAAAIYAERRLIAATFVQRYFQAYGIESEIEFDRLAWGGFLARVRAGSVDAPDFTVEGVDVTLVYPNNSSFSASVTPQVAAVRLIRPLVRITYDGETLSFGSLQRLVDDILAMESDVPGPEIAIDDGRLLLTTPYGAVTLLADVAIDKSKLTRLDAKVEHSMLKNETLAADITGGTVTAAMTGDAMNAKASLSLASLTQGVRTARGIDLDADIRGLKWQDNADGYTFVLDTIALNIGTAAAAAPEFSADRATARDALPDVGAPGPAAIAEARLDDHVLSRSHRVQGRALRRGRFPEGSQVGHGASAGLELRHVGLLVVEAALDEDLQQGIVPVRPLERAVGHAHVQSRAVTAPEEVRKIRGGEVECAAGELHVRVTRSSPSARRRWLPPRSRGRAPRSSRGLQSPRRAGSSAARRPW